MQHKSGGLRASSPPPFSLYVSHSLRRLSVCCFINTVLCLKSYNQKLAGEGKRTGLFSFASIRPALLPGGKRGLRAAIRRIARPSSAFGRRSTENQKTTICRRKSNSLIEKRKCFPPLPGRPAKLARLCAKRTAKNLRQSEKMSLLIFLGVTQVFLLPGSSLCDAQVTGANCL